MIFLNISFECSFNQFLIILFTDLVSNYLETSHNISILTLILKKLDKNLILLLLLNQSYHSLKILQLSDSLSLQSIEDLRWFFFRLNIEHSFTDTSVSWASTHHLLHFMIISHWNSDEDDCIFLEASIYTSTLISVEKKNTIVPSSDLVDNINWTTFCEFLLVFFHMFY